MAEQSINRTVANAVAFYLRHARITEAQLGKMAGVSPRTVANFLRPESRVSGSRGKEPSGKLTELALIATALGVGVEDLVVDMSDIEREQRRRLALAARILKDGDEALQHSLDSEHV